MNVNDHHQEGQMSEEQTQKRIEYSYQGRVSAVELLTAQHREVEQLFSELENLDVKAYRKKESLFKIIAEKLMLHTALEEKFFYPSVKNEDLDGTLEAYEEHAVVKELLRRIQRTKASDVSFKAKVKFLRELVEHHVFEEEDELFPIWQESTDIDEQFDVGAKMEAMVEKKSADKKAKRKKAVARKRYH